MSLLSKRIRWLHYHHYSVAKIFCVNCLCYGYVLIFFRWEQNPISLPVPPPPLPEFLIQGNLPPFFFFNSFFTSYSSKSVEKQQHIITVSGMSVVANVCNPVRCGWCSDTWAISILPQSLGTFIHDTYLKSNYRKITDFMVSVRI